MVLLHNSILFNQLRPPHLLFILKSSLSSPNINLFLIIPRYFPLSGDAHDHFIPFSLKIFLSMFSLIFTYFPQKMKLRNFFRNCSRQVLSIIVPTLIILVSLWYSIKKSHGACDLLFGPSTKLPSKINSPFLSLMTFWMN